MMVSKGDKWMTKEVIGKGNKESMMSWKPNDQKCISNDTLLLLKQVTWGLRIYLCICEDKDHNNLHKNFQWSHGGKSLTGLVQRPWEKRFREDGSKVGGSWTHLLTHPTATPRQSSEEQSERPMESQLIWSLEAKDWRGHLKTDGKEIW